MKDAHTFLGIFAPEGLGPRGESPEGELRVRGKLGGRDCVEFRLRNTVSGHPGGHIVEASRVLLWSGTPSRWGLELAQQAPADARGRALLARWDRLGERAFDDLGGVLSVLIWEGDTGRLWCFRDKLGLVPIRYAETGSAVGVSNDPRWLTRWRGQQTGQARRADRWRLAGFLEGNSDTSRQDFVSGVRRLRAHEYAVWNADLEVGFGHYWTEPTGGERITDIDFAAGELRRRIGQVLRSHDPESSVVAMSGGIDSAFLAAQWAQTCRGKRSRARVASMVAPGIEYFDESDDISRLEQQLSLEVHRCDISQWWPLCETGRLGQLPEYGPQPHPGGYHLSRFYQQVQRRFGPVRFIQGDAAEILLRGNIARALRSLWRERRLSEFILKGWMLEPASLLRIPLVGTLRANLPRPIFDAVKSTYRRLGALRDPPAWLKPQDWLLRGPRHEHMAPIDVLPASSEGDRRQQLLASWRWEAFSRAAAQNSQLTQVRCDFPYLEPRVWELCLAVDEIELVGVDQRKRLLQHAARGRVPERVRVKPKEGVFDQIVQRGLGIEEVDTVHALMDDSHLAELGLIEPGKFLQAYGAYRRAIEQCDNGRCIGSFPLWRTISAELWHRQL